ncbi:unnamed protein product [Rhodiola kirilowii]
MGRKRFRIGPYESYAESGSRFVKRWTGCVYGWADAIWFLGNPKSHWKPLKIYRKNHLLLAAPIFRSLTVSNYLFLGGFRKL